MRLAIVNLTGGGLSLGYRKYLEQMLPRLAAHRAIEALAVFAPARAGTGRSIKGVPVQFWEPRDAWFGLRTVRREIRTRGMDVVFVPTARRFEMPGIPTVVMVRNMEPFEVPYRTNPTPEAVRNVLRLREARRACRAADRVIAVSDHVRTHLVRRWHLDPGSIGVVRHGVDEPVAAPAVPAIWRDGVAPTFLLTAGSLRPARGLEDLIRAMPVLTRAFPGLTAAIAGGEDRFMSSYVDGLRRLASGLGVADRVLWLGKLDASEMAWCFTRASLFVMTSRAEACPNIALEAMSHGCACVSTDRQPMPEFFADSALYYREGDAVQLADKIDTLLRSPVEMAGRRAAALQRVKVFTWERTVAETVAQMQAASGAVTPHDATASSAGPIAAGDRS